MRICLICEGSYPYITGGVSSWIQMLVNNLKEHQFIIYAISPYEKDKGKFKYTLPDNIEKVYEIFLDSALKEKGSYGKRYKMKKEIKDAVVSLICAKENVDIDLIAEFISSKKVRSVHDFFMSIDFFEIIKEAYLKAYESIPFTEYFWAVRSMLLPLFYIMKQDIPKADLYHSVSTGYAGLVAQVAKKRHGSPYILTEHGIYTREREEEIIKSTWIQRYFKKMWIGFFLALAKSSYLAVDHVYSLFEKNKEIEIELGLPKEKVTVVPNGVDIDRFKDLENEKWQKDKFYIGSVLRIVPIKDVKTMLYAFYKLKEEISEAELYLMGPTDEDEEYYKECEAIVKDLELKDVHFEGRVNVLDYLGRMDIIWLSSISEGQPLAILEAMAAKKTFVATDVGCIKELVYGNDDEYSKAGEVVPVMDYNMLAKKTVLLYTDTKRKKQYEEAALKRVISSYTLDKFINTYRLIYQKFEEEAWQE